jgi:hypothetical protein
MHRPILWVFLAAVSGIRGVCAQQTPQFQDTVAYTTTTLRLREQPLLTARVVATLPPATQLRTYACADGWCGVTVRQLAGYVSAEFLTLLPPPGTVTPTGRGYINSRGEWVPSPQRTPDDQPPPGATAQCRDGTYSFSRTRRGTCSHHGGVARWLTP